MCVCIYAYIYIYRERERGCFMPRYAIFLKEPFQGVVDGSKQRVEHLQLTTVFLTVVAAVPMLICTHFAAFRSSVPCHKDVY